MKNWAFRKLKRKMRGTFNGAPIRDVIALKISGSPGRVVLRALGCPRPHLEKQFALRSEAFVKISVHEIEGTVVGYDRAAQEGVYEVTIQTRD